VPYFLEEISEEKTITKKGSFAKYVVRSKKTMERLQTLRRNQLEQWYEKEYDMIRVKYEQSKINMQEMEYET